MINELKHIIEKIYINGEKDIFIDGCNKKLGFIEEIVMQYENSIPKIQLSDDDNLPSKEMYFKFEDFCKGEFKVSYSSVLSISKVCKVFYLQHEFSIDNVDDNRMDLTLDSFGDQPYTKQQFVFDEDIVSFMLKQGYYRLTCSELEKVIPSIEMPKDSIFGIQMTVENAIFRDVWEIYTEK